MKNKLALIPFAALFMGGAWAADTDIRKWDECALQYDQAARDASAKAAQHEEKIALSDTSVLWQSWLASVQLESLAQFATGQLQKQWDSLAAERPIDPARFEELQREWRETSLRELIAEEKQRRAWVAWTNVAVRVPTANEARERDSLRRMAELERARAEQSAAAANLCRQESLRLSLDRQAVRLMEEIGGLDSPQSAVPNATAYAKEKR